MLLIREAPNKFTDKERDEKTGYDYFGARYYDSDLSQWLSVDPMSDKYHNLSPYNYCAWNPVILVDPDGNSTIRFTIMMVIFWELTIKDCRGKLFL
jgi:RHS repeat-associated protein